MIEYTVRMKDGNTESFEKSTLKEAFDDIARHFSNEELRWVEFRRDFTKLKTYEDFMLFMSGVMYLKNHLMNL